MLVLELFEDSTAKELNQIVMYLDQVGEFNEHETYFKFKINFDQHLETL